MQFIAGNNTKSEVYVAFVCVAKALFTCYCIRTGVAKIFIVGQIPDRMLYIINLP